MANTGISTLAATATAEEVTEDIAEDIGEVLTAKTSAAATHAWIDTGMAVLVVGRTLIGIRQAFVGLIGLFEQFFGFFAIRITVRVMLHRQATVSLLQVRLAGAVQRGQRGLRMPV